MSEADTNHKLDQAAEIEAAIADFKIYLAAGIVVQATYGDIPCDVAMRDIYEKFSTFADRITNA